MCEWNTIELIEIANGEVIQVDSCIRDLVESLNDHGIPTIASCCGHNKRPGSIVLEDGRHLEILPDRQTWDDVQVAYKHAGLFEPINPV